MYIDCLSQEAALSAEMTAKEGLRIAMEKKERQFKNEIEALEFQVQYRKTWLKLNIIDCNNIIDYIIGYGLYCKS